MDDLDSVTAEAYRALQIAAGIVQMSDPTPQVRFIQAHYDEVAESMRPLLEKHWREIALYQDRIKLEPDWEWYRTVDAMGKLFALTVFVNDHLAGYCIYIVNENKHYKRHKWAVSDIFWVNPAVRNHGIGAQMFQHAERLLKAQGVSVMHTTSKAAHPEARDLLESLGHELVEYGHSKLLL